MRIELKFEEGEGVCEGRGEERASCRDRETGREEQGQRHSPGWGQVAGGELKLEVWVGVSKAWLGQRISGRRRKIETGVAGGRCSDHGGPGNHRREVDLQSFRRERHI